MKIYTCCDKKSDSNNTYYILRDVKSNSEVQVDSNSLKESMKNKQVDVMNLTLTSDNRIIKAGKDKMDKLKSMAKAPASIADKLVPLNNSHENKIEELMDEIMSGCIDKYLQGLGKYVKLRSFNKENNTCVLEFTLGLNSFVLLHYDKICYGEIMSDGFINRVCFDIVIDAVSFSNRKESIKLDSSKIIIASKELSGFNDLRCDKDKCLIVEYKGNGDTFMWNLDIVNKMQKHLGNCIMIEVSKQLSEICANNPNIANNTNAQDYIRYDKLKKEYMVSNSVVAGVTIATSVGVAAIVALCTAANPEVLRTGMLAKLALGGSTSQIIGAITAYAGASGLGTGALGATAVAIKNRKDTSGRRKELKEYEKQIKNEKVGLFNMFNRKK